MGLPGGGSQLVAEPGLYVRLAGSVDLILPKVLGREAQNFTLILEPSASSALFLGCEAVILLCDVSGRRMESNS